MTRTAARRDSQSHAARIELNAFLGAAYETGVAVSPGVAAARGESATHVNRAACGLHDRGAAPSPLAQ